MDIDSDHHFKLSCTSTSTSFSFPRYIPSTSSLVFKTTLAYKIDHQFEITTTYNEQKISETNLSLVNSYHVFAKKPVSVIRTIKTLVKQLVHTIKECVQAYGFD